MIKHVTVEGHSLAYQWINKMPLTPESPVVLFLHEGLGCMRLWKDFPAKLCSKLNCSGLMYDRYGYGESDKIEGGREKDFLYYEAAKTLPELLKKIGVNGPLMLFGHSDGGTIALIFGALFPDRTLSIVAEASHIFIEPVTINGIHHAIRNYKYGRLRDKLAKYHGDKTDSMFYSWANVWTSGENEGWSIEPILPDINSPVMVIQGEHDNYGTSVQTKKITSGIKGKHRILNIPDCGHIPHHEKRETVLYHTADFFNGQLEPV